MNKNHLLVSVTALVFLGIVAAVFFIQKSESSVVTDRMDVVADVREDEYQYLDISIFNIKLPSTGWRVGESNYSVVTADYTERIGDFWNKTGDWECVEAHTAKTGAQIIFDYFAEAVNTNIESSEDYAVWAEELAYSITGVEEVKRISIDGVPFVYSRGFLPECGPYVLVKGRFDGHMAKINAYYNDPKRLNEINALISEITLDK